MAKKKSKEEDNEKKKILLEAIEKLEDEGTSLKVACEIMSLAYSHNATEEAKEGLKTMALSVVGDINKAAKEVETLFSAQKAK